MRGIANSAVQTEASQAPPRCFIHHSLVVMFSPTPCRPHPPHFWLTSPLPPTPLYDFPQHCSAEPRCG